VVFLQHFICTISIKIALQTYKVKLTGSVIGVYSGWDSFLLIYGGEVFLDEVSSV